MMMWKRIGTGFISAKVRMKHLESSLQWLETYMVRIGEKK
jgi:hypothetical protein